MTMSWASEVASAQDFERGVVSFAPQGLIPVRIAVRRLTLGMASGTVVAVIPPRRLL